MPRVIQIDAETGRRLVDALVECKEEIQRLHGLIGVEYQGKVGEPDLELVEYAHKSIINYYNNRQIVEIK